MKTIIIVFSFFFTFPPVSCGSSGKIPEIVMTVMLIFDDDYFEHDNASERYLVIQLIITAGVKLSKCLFHLKHSKFTSLL